MNLNSYIILDYSTDNHDIKMKFVKGFTRDQVKQSLNVKTGWAPQGNDKLFFFPGCAVPRFKVREKFACTIKPANATAAFISDDMVGSDNTFDFYGNVVFVNHGHIVQFIKKLNNDRYFDIFQSFYTNNKNVKIALSKRLWYDHMWRATFTNDNSALNGYLPQSRWSYKYEIMHKPENQLLAFNKNSADIANMQCDIYAESDILKVLNEDQFVIDETKYKELRAFGQTEDSENLVLMMELMSNCDYNKSLVHLLFLLKEFGADIQDRKEAQHVNFKSLLSYLELDIKELNSLDINYLTRILRKHKRFTRENVSIITSLCSVDQINYISSDNLCWTQGPVLKTSCIELLQDDTDN